jgi:hypothetical protein
VANLEDAQVVADLVFEAGSFLNWCAGAESVLDSEDEDDRESTPVIPYDLQAVYSAAVEQLLALHVQLAMMTLSGSNLQFPMSAVLATLEQAGWDGPMRDFKLEVLERSGRAEVRNVTGGGRRNGRLRRRVFQSFSGALNAALDSLQGIPGVAPIKELKDFVERLAGG